jgi:hypothetical protein
MTKLSTSAILRTELQCRFKKNRLALAAWWLSILIAITVFSPPAIYATEISKYYGMVLSEENFPEFRTWGGQCLSADSNNAIPCQFNLTGGLILNSTGKKGYVTLLASNTNTKNSANEIIWIIEDSIDHAYKKSKTFDVDTCKSNRHIGEKIIATGSWIARKPPLVGGYMRAIDKAWRVDLKNKKFVPIANKGTFCDLNADRN